MNLRVGIIAAAVSASLASALSVSPPVAMIDGLSLDLLFWLTDRLYDSRHAAIESPTVVIAIDEETYRRSPFKDSPDALWTPYLGTTIEAVLEAGARFIGFDVILPTSAEGLLAGYDHDLLLALRNAARSDRILLSKAQSSTMPVLPHRGYIYAVGGSHNVRATTLLSDADDVVRRVPMVLREVDGDRYESTFALEVAARASGHPIQVRDGQVFLGDEIVPTDSNFGALVNFDGRELLPTYSLADIHACIEQGVTDFLREHLGGKIVLFGAVLDVEDRRLTSRRFLPHTLAVAPRCTESSSSAATGDVARSTLPAVYILGQTINDLLRRESLRRPDILQEAGISFLFALAFALLALFWAPVILYSAMAGVLAVWTLGATMSFRFGMVLPLLDPIWTSIAAVGAMMAFRATVTDRDRHRLRRAFAYYLNPTLIEKIVSSDRPPVLGGEERTITVWFSDVVGFTTWAEHKAPQEIVELLNRYFTLAGEIIERHGGFVDKFVGDGIVAIFGAPLDRTDHATAAVSAALDLHSALCGYEMQSVATRIGINTGPAIVGNIGSRQRFNYTAVGDTVNVASRLEGANKTLGTSILVSDATRACCGTQHRFREIGRIRVTGREVGLAVFEPISDTLDAALQQEFATALNAFHRGNFAAAHAAFASLSPKDAVSAKYAQLAKKMLDKPPAPDWDGTVHLFDK